MNWRVGHKNQCFKSKKINLFSLNEFSLRLVEVNAIYTKIYKNKLLRSIIFAFVLIRLVNIGLLYSLKQVILLKNK
jgi:hypothetical protein